MTRKAGKKHPCPSCGRLVGTYQSATGPMKTVKHMVMGDNVVKTHKAVGAPWCEGGSLPREDPYAAEERAAIQEYEKECEEEER